MAPPSRWWMVVLLLALLPTLPLGGDAHEGNGQRWTEAYDHYFKKYSKHYFGPNFNWRWFKAQGIAESALHPDAESSAGAKGLMQILPSTYEDIKKSNPHFVKIDEPRWNIAAGIFYDRYLYRRWHKRLSRRECIRITFASYNAGLGRVYAAYHRAQRTQGKVHKWQHVAPYAPQETRTYVKRIHRLMDEIQ